MSKELPFPGKLSRVQLCNVGRSSSRHFPFSKALGGNIWKPPDSLKNKWMHSIKLLHGQIWRHEILRGVIEDGMRQLWVGLAIPSCLCRMRYTQRVCCANTLVSQAMTYLTSAYRTEQFCRQDRESTYLNTKLSHFQVWWWLASRKKYRTMQERQCHTINAIFLTRSSGTM